MAMFSSKDSNASLPAALRTTGHEPGLSILAAGIRVVGEIETDGVVKIEGEVEGSVRAEGQVLVAKGGVVRGDISTRQAVIAGEVHGGIFGDERVELQPSSVIDGDITAPRIVVAEGGQVNGNIRMTSPPTNATHQKGDKSGGGKGEKPTGSGRQQPFELAGSSGISPPPSATAGGTERWAKTD